MAISRVNFLSSSVSSAAGHSLVVASVLASDTLVIGVYIYENPSTTITGITLTSNSNPTARGSIATGGPNDGRIAWYTSDNVGTGGSLTITTTLSGATTNGIVCWHLRGADTSGAVDGTTQTASGNSTTPSVNITTSVTNAAIFALVSAGGDASSAGIGYTLETITDFFWYDSGEYDIDVGSTGAKTVDMTLGSSGQWVINAIAIKPPGGGSTATGGMASGGRLTRGILNGSLVG